MNMKNITPAQRAKKLLMRFLTPAQRHQLESIGEFTLELRRGSYVISVVGVDQYSHYNCNVRRKGPTGRDSILGTHLHRENLWSDDPCLNDPNFVPVYDFILIQLLMLKSNERRFNRLACK